MRWSACPLPRNTTRFCPHSAKHQISGASRDAGDTSYRPRDSFKLKVERQIGSMKQWVGTAAELEKRLPEIARDILAMLQAQGVQRKIVDAERASRARV